MTHKEHSIYMDYFQLTKEHQATYGERVVVLMQVGAFFEVYSLKNPHTGSYEVTQIAAFAEICNLNIAEKKITVGDSTEPLSTYPPFPGKGDGYIKQWLKSLPPSQVVMAGMRDYCLEKYIQKLMDAGFTTAVYVQDGTGRNIVRKLQNVYSPGTFLAHEADSQAKLTNHIMCIWFEVSERKERKERKECKECKDSNSTLICGIASINIFTGESAMFEYQTPMYMNPTTFDELERYISTCTPSELIIVTENTPEGFVDTAIKYAGVPTQTTVHCVDIPAQFEIATGTTQTPIQKAVNCTRQTYLHQILRTFYTDEVYDVCYEFQSNVVATQAFGYLLNFVQEHNADLVRNIHIPSFSNSSRRTLLANHTLKQLNIISDDTQDGKASRNLSSVTTFLNRCCTAMGKRKFHHRMTNPVFDETWLQTEYDMIDFVLNRFCQKAIIDVRKTLSNMRDIEKIGRQLLAKRIYPSSIYQLHHTCKELQFLYQYHVLPYPECVEYAREKDPDSSIQTDLPAFIEFLETHFFLDKCASVHSMNQFEENILQPHVSPELQQHLQQQVEWKDTLDHIKNELNQLLGGGGDSEADLIKLHETDKNGISLLVTKKRGATLKQRCLDHPQSTIGTAVKVALKDIKLVSATQGYDMIEFPLLKHTTECIKEGQDTMNTLIGVLYRQLLGTMETSWYPALECFSQYISTFDVLFTKAYIAREYNYCKPRIQESSGDEAKSFVQAKGIRHVLIEHLQTNELYVTNDISIDQDIILLYGTNAVGKTSIIRALGIAVILAQSGCYVPCHDFLYKPYTSIFTRILGNDNIFKGLSTFAVEMSELRIILKMCDQRSLVLGDELCSGTETESALSIFMAGLMHLHTTSASCIFATHFHEIIQYEEMTTLPRIRIKHMSVVYDREEDCLVYDRLLKDGPGNRMYGLEVCKSLYLPPDFLESAYQIRNKYHPVHRGELSNKPSIYNAQKIRGMCEVCNEQLGEEIHHLQYQQDSDANGFIGHFHKNHPANLLSVCHACHDKMHQDDRSDTTSITGSRTSPPRKMVVVRKKTTKGYKISTKTVI